MSVFGQENEMVGDITLQTLLNGEVDFLIPPYQRGYRWRGKEVKALIDDLCAFFGQNSNSRYCLQPLVVQPTRVETSFILVDGQQRLTTLAILLLSIGKDVRSCNILKILEDRSCRNDDGKKVWTIKPRDNDAKDGKLSDYCRQNALRIALRHKKEIQEIRKHLNRIVFVFYKLKPYESEIDDKVARDAFRRINAGKVSLSSSELLRALFFEPDVIDSFEQHEIAAEWEQIQQRLKDDSFWHMFNKDSVPVFRRMDMFFSIVAKCESKNASSRLAFDKIEADIAIASTGELKREKLSSWWKAAMDLFWMLQFCYSDLRVYHYIGWLRRCSDYSFAELYSIYKEKGSGKFADELRRRIAEKMKDKLKMVKKCDPDDDNKTFETLGYCYNDEKKDIRSFLLLVNLEMMNRMYASSSVVDSSEFDSDVGYGYCRFPFSLYDATKWDVEHVASHTTNPMESSKERRQWAEGVMCETGDGELKRELEAWLKENSREEADNGEQAHSAAEDRFVSLYNKWVEGVGRNEFPTEMQKNRIGNLVLLDSITNRGYGNSIFPVKRRIIHEVETGVKIVEGGVRSTEHRFVLPHTSNVFKKSSSSGNPKTLQAWTVDDIKNNELEMLQLVESFMK